MVTQKNLNTRIHNTLPVAREGFPFIAIGAAVTVVFLWAGLLLPGIILGILTIFIISFFRDPNRSPEGPENALYSPADGRVIKVKELADSDNPLGGPCMLTCIFMSIFNVHVNRITATGIVKSIRYTAGRFFAANLDKASEQNERNQVLLEMPDGQQLVIVQIAGLIARRIACWIEPGDRVAAGQRFGLIRFGSRLDVYMPKGTRIAVKPGQKVRAGKSIIGYHEGHGR